MLFIGGNINEKAGERLRGIMQEDGLVVTQVQVVSDVQINQGLILIKFVKRLEY
jgi:hypothetical protein